MLLTIKDQIQYYAETISAVTGLEVEVVNVDLIRIAGTGPYAGGAGKSIQQAGNLLKTTLKENRLLFIENPRHNEICEGCKNKSQCRERLSICAPIADGKRLYGALELVCFATPCRERVLAQRDIYLNFMSLLASSIAVRISERQEYEDIRALLDVMSQVVNTNDKGTILYDTTGKVAFRNERAQEILQKTIPSHFENFDVTPTGISFSNVDEYVVTQDDRQQLVVGRSVEVESDNSRFSSVFVFDTIQSVVSHSLHSGSADFDGSLDHIIGQSASMVRLKDQIVATGKTSSSVLITGESGTGKELVARAIHAIGDRADAPFVAINCGAIPDTLLESELFGYVGGAFTGASSKGQIGKFELAEGGVLFLDEISSMPLYLQVKLLRALQERTITRLGAKRPVHVDIRVIAATNDNLPELIEQNMFRSDLFYRLNVIPLHTPPLRGRIEDLELLVEHFVSKYCTLFEKRKITIPASILKNMRDYEWPGNIRELENAVEYLVNMADDEGVLHEENLHSQFLQKKKKRQHKASEETSDYPIVPLHDLERQAIERALAFYGDSTSAKKQVARALGISLATLYRKLAKMGL